jgi:hypothetical protein
VGGGPQLNITRDGESDQVGAEEEVWREEAASKG